MTRFLRLFFPARLPALVAPIRHVYTPLQIKLFAVGMVK